MSARILIFDDVPRWTEFARNDLRAFETVFATDLKTALDHLDTHQFDLVIVSSRHINVLETIKTKHPDERVAIITVQPKTEEALRSYRLGAIRYFNKSFGHDDLLNHVKDLIPAFTSTA
jgi:DNA-binding NtrC family response regulator